MASDSSDSCFDLWSQLSNVCPFTAESIHLRQILSDFLLHYCTIAGDLEAYGKFSKPLPWIGVYIAAASVICILAMVADLLHGFRNRKLWFPCKYFTLNAASITVISVALKLPLDLNNPMPGNVDQVAKLGSMAFMCTMLANLMPSLATMDNKELVMNVVALGILVITVIVNFCIQIKTKLLGYATMASSYHSFYSSGYFIVYVALTIFLLVILTSLALTIPSFKRILEAKYQVAHKNSSNDQHSPNVTVEELQQHVKRYWVMAGTGSPQFAMASSPLCSASGVICVSVVVFHIFTVAHMDIRSYYKDYRSDYSWSMVLILITQFIGVILGAIAPTFRCFTALGFELSLNWSRNHINIFKVESYYVQKLSDWKHSHINFQIGGRKFKIFVHNVKNLVLGLCIMFDKIVVVACKTIGLVPILIVVFFLYCLNFFKPLKSKFFPSPLASNNNMASMHEQNHRSEDLSNYVLQLQDQMVLAQRTLKLISTSANRLIQKAEKQLPNNLLKLLEKSTGFEGVEKFDSVHVPPLLSMEPLNSWSLPVVTLTSIAIMLPNIQRNKVDSLLSGVDEGLLFASLVEEHLNSSDEYVNQQKAAKKLWLEVEVHCKWLKNDLKRSAHKYKTSNTILQWFSDKSEEIVVEIKKSMNEGKEEIDQYKLIIAYSMYRVTKTILLNYHGRIEQVSEEELFVHLSGMIVDILAACLTNLPRVIAMKCYENVIEKREESVATAAKILGQCKEMIKKLQEREYPSLDPEEMAFIDDWHAFLNKRFP